MKTYITGESVSSGHPDKICDQISDGILDACLEQDPDSRVACEVMTTTWTIIISWEITTKAWVNFADIARKIVNDIWYNSEEASFSAYDVSVQTLINSQSPDIAQWVDTWWAWDQWLMFGYACRENEAFLPTPIYLAHRLAERLENVRKDWTLDYLLPDWKTQVTVEYDDDKLVRVDAIVVSSQHKENIDQETLKKDIKKEVIDSVLWDLVDENTKIHINPTWIFHIWWPKWDCGLTWRKIIVDTYWWIGRHGWGAFSWKDPSKVDRSWAYIARYLAKNIVASWVCDKCEIQLSYAIWVKEPVSIYIDCFQTEKIDREKIIEAIKDNFDLSPNGIIKKLDLKRPIYQKTATHWHFWRDGFSWEELDSVEIFKSLV